MRSTPRFVAAATLTLLLTATAACSRDDESEPDDSAPIATTTEAAISPAVDFDLPEAVKIVSLIADKTISTDPNAIDDFNDGARFAIEDINAAGGLGGRPIEFVPIDTPPVGDGVANAFNLALAEEPTAILGPASSTAALVVSPLIDRAQIPTLHNATDAKLATDGEAGSDWLFGTRPANDTAAGYAAQFATEELGATNLGLMNTSTAFGEQGAAAVREGLGGAQIGAERSFPFNATDLSTEVRAMAGTDAVIDWGTPNTLALAVKTFAQQGLRDVPHIGPGSVGFSSFREGVGDDALLENVYGAVDCNPTDDDRPAPGAWAARFEAKFGYPPSYSSAEMYDAVFLLRKVIEQAKSADPAAVRDGLAELSGVEGICSADYTNDNGFLIHQTVVGRYQDGEFVTQKVY